MEVPNGKTFSDGDYTPGSYVEDLHNTPRWDHRFQPVANHLPAVWGDVTDQDSPITEYLQGTAMLAAIALAIGCVIWVALVLAYPIACCKLCCCGRKQRGAEIVKPWCARWWIWIAGAGYCAAIIAAFVATGSLDKGINDTPDLLRGVDDILRSANTSTAGIVVDAANMSTVATSIAGLNWNNATGPQLANMIASSSNEASDAVADTSYVIGEMLGNTESAADWLEKNKKFFADLAWAWTAVCLVLMLAIMFSLCECGFCECTNKVLNIVGLVFLITSWAFAFIFQMASYTVADYCNSPSFYTNNVVANSLPDFSGGAILNSTAGLVLSSTKYYMTECDPSGDFPAAGIYAFALEGKANITQAAGAVQQLSGMRNGVATSDRAQFDTLMGTLSGATTSAQEAANDAANTLTCDRVLHEWHKVVDVVCTTAGNDGLLPLWAATLGSTVLFTIVMMGGVAVCRNHPVADKRERRRAEENQPLNHGEVATANPVAEAQPQGLPLGGAAAPKPAAEEW